MQNEIFVFCLVFFIAKEPWFTLKVNLAIVINVWNFVSVGSVFVFFQNGIGLAIAISKQPGRDFVFVCLGGKNVLTQCVV